MPLSLLMSITTRVDIAFAVSRITCFMINTGLDHHEVFGEGITSDWEAGVVSGAARLAASKILRTIIRPQFVRQFSVQDATDQVKRPDWRFSIK